MRLAGALLSGSLVALLAACGSSASSTGATGSDSGSATAGASSPPASSVPATSPSATGGGISPHASVAGCATANLRVTLGTSNGAAGSVYLPIDFTNTGTADCTLYGYPGVSLTGGSPAGQIGAAADRNPQTAATVVTLAPGAVAHATLQVTVAGNYPAGTCQPTAATTLVIYPPGQTAAASVPYSTTGCKSTSITILHVEVVQPGA